MATVSTASFFDDESMRRLEKFNEDSRSSNRGEQDGSGEEEGSDAGARSGEEEEEVVQPTPKKSKVLAKKAAAKAAQKPFDWRITIATPQTFKTSVTIMCRILTQCSFQLIKTPAFTGLRVDSMDSSMVCMIKSSYECEIESGLDLKAEMFCVDTKLLNTLLKDVQPGHILTLTRFENDEEVTLDSYARDDCSNRFTCTLNILEDDPKVPRMQSITYDFMVEMDLARLKSYCKMAQELNSSHMEFKILEPPADDDDEAGERHFFFVVGATGDSGGAFQRIFHSAVASETDAAVQGGEGGHGAHVTIRALSVEGGQRESSVAPLDFAAVQHTFAAKYSEVFSTTYLNTVLKSMDRQTVQLFMSEKVPLVIKYGLGNDLSHVQVILAPRLRDD